jgi:hypothetical protein
LFFTPKPAAYPRLPIQAQRRLPFLVTQFLNEKHGGKMNAKRHTEKYVPCGRHHPFRTERENAGCEASDFRARLYQSGKSSKRTIVQCIKSACSVVQTHNFIIKL